LFDFELHIYIYINSAEQWNLASPLATCSLLVERRDDCLVLDFRQQPQPQQLQRSGPSALDHDNTTPNDSSSSSGTAAIFAQATIDCSIPTRSNQNNAVGTTTGVTENGDNDDTTEISSSSTQTQLPQQQQAPQRRKIQHWIEGTVDSSRYFTLRISTSTSTSTSSDGNHREAMIGFGVRDRDSAIDLREALQYYEASMRREYEATTMTNTVAIVSSNNKNDDTHPDNNSGGCTSAQSSTSKYSIPKLAEGERIHIARLGTTTSARNESKMITTNGSTNKQPILLKKPPPPSAPLTTIFATTDDDPVSLLQKDLRNACHVTSTTTTTASIAPSQNGPIEERGKKDDNNNDVQDDDDDDWETEFVSANNG
jgi:Protein of unknown function (DUF1681)